MNSTHAPFSVTVVNDSPVRQGKAAVPDKSSLSISPIRIFKDRASSKIVILAGELDVEVHDIWLLEGNKASLVGTLTLDFYKKMRRSKHLTLEKSQFDFLSKSVDLPLALDYVENFTAPADCIYEVLD